MASDSPDWIAQMGALAERVGRREHEKNGNAHALPSHHDWPPELKAWLVCQLVMQRMALYKSKQTPWENLLRAALVGVSSKATPGPDGRFWPMNGPLDEMLISASELAAAWRGSDEHKRFLKLLSGSPDDE